MAHLLDAARADATEGEMVQALQRVFGTYSETPTFCARLGARRALQFRASRSHPVRDCACSDGLLPREEDSRRRREAWP